MESYFIYVGLTVATVLLPGPAVFLTLNNAIQVGKMRTLAGILGISSAILIVASISATSLAVILASSAVAFSIIKYLGAAYLIYLGIKMLRTKQEMTTKAPIKQTSYSKHFIEGFLISISNPKAVIFFMSVFPQFIDPAKDYLPQVSLLAITFSVLVIPIHSLYTLLATYAKAKLTSAKGRSTLNKTTGGIFVGLGVGIAASSR